MFIIFHYTQISPLEIELRDKLCALRNKYEHSGQIKAVTLDEIEAVEWLERRICKLVCKELVTNGSIQSKYTYIGVVLGSALNHLPHELSHELILFETKEEASKWSCDTQKRKYSETTPWLDNPFCGGVYFETEAFTSSGNSN